MSNIREPNVVLPLTPSYNPRGQQDAWTNTDTNALDQRKVNSFYEVVGNSLSGNQTVYLSRRPGAYVAADTLGQSTQVPYLLYRQAGATGTFASTCWLFSVDSSLVSTRISDTTTTVDLMSGAGYYPAYVDSTAISGVDTAVVQVVWQATGDQRTFYGSTVSTFTEITDPTFTSLAHSGKMEHLDGFAFVCDSSTGRIYNSKLNTLATWDPTNFIAKQIKQDVALGLGRLGKKIVCFGIESTEVFANAGNEVGSPLVSIPDLQSNVGTYLCGSQNASLKSTHYYAVLGGKMYFVGRQGLGSVGLYMFDGGSFHKVSRGPMDKALYEIVDSSLLQSVSKFTFQGNEAIALSLTTPNNALQKWLMYFPAWNDWFEWQSYSYGPVNNGLFHIGTAAGHRHRLYYLPSPLADATSGVATTTIPWVHQFQMPKDGNSFHRMDMCQLIGDTAAATSSFSVNVQFSDDDGASWSASTAIDMTSKRKMLTRLGSYETRLVRLSASLSTGELRLQSFAAKVSK